MVEIKCSYHKLVEPRNLRPNPMNPNTHPDSQLELMAKIIKVTGWRDPIAVSNRTGLIVRGHGRLMVAKMLEMEWVPVEYQDYESEADEIADLAGDNRIQELNYIDPDLLKQLLVQLPDESTRLMTGFSLDELEKFMGDHTGFLDDFISEPGSDETDEPEPAGGDPVPAGEKYFKLPLLFPVSDRDFIIDVVSRYQVKHQMNVSSEALLRLLMEWDKRG
jgi:hypothetical protein